MSRKKVIMREQILKAAYEIVVDSNFSNLTARNVADKLNCSTQPIYIEFENMDDLKFVVYQKMKDELQFWLKKESSFSKDPLINLCINYIDFATTKNSIHKALANDNFGASRDFKIFIYTQFCREMKKDDVYKILTENDKQRLIGLMWQFTIGITSTVLNGLAAFDETKFAQGLEEIECWAIQHKEFPILM